VVKESFTNRKRNIERLDFSGKVFQRELGNLLRRGGHKW